MTNFENLFSYGSLQLEVVQKELFGRILIGLDDSIEGYKLSSIQFTENKTKTEYPILDYTANSNDIVDGKVFELTMDEILIADEYETNSYIRIKTKLQSGVEAWVYVKP